MEKNDPLTPPRILVANDTRDLADLYCVLFASTGYIVSRAYDGLTALALAKVTKPDVIVLDYLMPGLNGLQVLQELREAGVRSKVVLTSAAPAFDELAGRAHQEGVEACLRQPCAPEQLTWAVARLLQRSRDLANP